VVGLGACAAPADEGDTSGGSAISATGGANDAPGSTAAAAPSKDTAIPLDHWRSNPQLKPLIQIVLDVSRASLDKVQVMCGPTGSLNSIQQSDPGTTTVREVSEMDLRPSESDIRMKNTRWIYDTKGKLVLLELDRIGDGGKNLSTQTVFVKDDKAIFQIVSPNGLSFAAEFPDDGVMLASDPAAKTKFRVGEYTLTPKDLSSQHPEFSDQAFRDEQQCKTM
jgi:hypothetical protein